MIALTPIIFQFAAVLSALNKFIDTLVEVDVNFSGKNGSNATADVHYFISNWFYNNASLTQLLN